MVLIRSLSTRWLKHASQVAFAPLFLQVQTAWANDYARVPEFGTTVSMDAIAGKDHTATSLSLSLSSVAGEKTLLIFFNRLPTGDLSAKYSSCSCLKSSQRLKPTR